ncbi:MAG: hypothetical protein QM523_01025 [Candidatus Pacebacteria bacterium]|nr:hypothetical protein [Candidatus Paceibacterota bacterium]
MINYDGWEKTERGWRKVYSALPTPVAGSDFPCPRVITDHMDPVQHVDGKFYESKSAFRAVTKREGYIEVGNDPARLRKPERPKPDPKKRREAVEKAAAQVLG